MFSPKYLPFCLAPNNLLRDFITGIILGMGWANERWCYIVTSSLIGWAHTQNDPRIIVILNTNNNLNQFIWVIIHYTNRHNMNKCHVDDSMTIYLGRRWWQGHVFWHILGNV